MSISAFGPRPRATQTPLIRAPGGFTQGPVSLTRAGTSPPALRVPGVRRVPGASARVPDVVGPGVRLAPGPGVARLAQRLSQVR
jgi:hypothetical protein